MLFLKGLIIGLFIGAPIGAVGALIVQRTLLFGKRYGFVTGAGSSFADCIYAAVGALGLTLVSDFLLDMQTPLGIVGGVFVMGMGLTSISRKTNIHNSGERKKGISGSFFSAFAVGITNPAAIFVMLVAFSYLNIPKLGLADCLILVAGVFSGTVIWWIILTMLAEKMRKNDVSLSKVNTAFGIVMLVLGAVLIVKSIFY